MKRTGMASSKKSLEYLRKPMNDIFWIFYNFDFLSLGFVSKVEKGKKIYRGWKGLGLLWSYLV
jgi:hypothetical protein